MVRLIVFNIDTSSCEIGWSLPYHFKTQLNLLGYYILCERESLYLINSMHDQNLLIPHTFYHIGGGPRVVVSTAASHARVRGSVPGLGGLKETRNVSSQTTCETRIVGSLRDREVPYSAWGRQGSNFESCVWSLTYMCTKMAQSPIHLIFFYHITTTSKKFLYFMLIFIKTSWSCYERYHCPNYHIFCIMLQ